MRKAVIAALAAALVVPAAASAGNYPPPSNPGKTPKARGKGRTLTVCKRGCRYKKIQKAIDAANGRDTIRVKKGVYHEGVKILGSRYDGLKLIGDRKHPDRVVFEGKGVPKGPNQNAVLINAADDVVVRGFHARNYKANCFFATNSQDYVLDHLVAERCGVYGIYAFNSKGGTMRDSEAYYNNDAGFYIGQTPAQEKPIRSIVTNIKSWGNPLGWSGTNMRYVTITKSFFFNNAAGIVPNALDSEKFPPAEDNVIADNDIFWNNFNFHDGAPFDVREEGTAALVPVGTGVLLLGGRRNTVENNRIYGNWTVGVALIEGFLLQENPQARALVGNEVVNNEFGLGGADLNGRELAYDGNGTENCFGGNAGVSVTVPANRSTLAACPFTGANAFSKAAQNEMFTLAGEGAVAKQIRHPHAPKAGFEPLEIYTP